MANPVTGVNFIETGAQFFYPNRSGVWEIESIAVLADQPQAGLQITARLFGGSEQATLAMRDFDRGVRTGEIAVVGW